MGSNAVSQDLSFEWRKEKGLRGGVVHLFYFAAFVLDTQQSVLGTFGQSPNDDVHVRLPSIPPTSLPTYYSQTHVG